jgi:hypothetical protein
MIEFQLFRLKVFPTTQGDLFRGEMTRTEVLSRVVRSLPEVELRAGSIWHIGNVTELDTDAMYFRLGRATVSTAERYRNGNFVDEPDEVAPYTHVVLDVQFELCAIAKKPRVSPTVQGIANAFARLLNESPEGSRLQARFEIGAMSDPEEFIELLATAHSVSKFWVTFSKPNPFDANADFVQPMQKLLREADGDQGKTEMKGLTLKSEVMQEVARSAAATGDDAGATVQLQHEGQKIRKSLRSHSVIVTQDQMDELDDKRTFLQRIRDVYNRIRGRNE